MTRRPLPGIVASVVGPQDTAAAGIKPCPFCGKSNASVEDHFDFGHVVVCRSCGAESMIASTVDKAIAAWNTRPDTAAASEARTTRTALMNEIETENDRLREALEQIEQWIAAYPETVFLPVSDTQLHHAARVLHDAGISMDALHGSWARHILAGLHTIVQSALSPAAAAASDARHAAVVAAARAYVAALRSDGYAPRVRVRVDVTLRALEAAVDELEEAA